MGLRPSDHILERAMSDEDASVVGQVYFEVKYPERCRKCPFIESFVFRGKNLSDEDTE
jgi:hypothetical protein